MSEEDLDSNGSQPGRTEADQQPGPDEAFCLDCGAVIKKRAEICPECGVRQQTEDSNQQPQHQQPQHQQQPAQPQQQPQQPQHQHQNQPAGGSNLTDRRQYELEKMASKDKATIALVGFLLSPVAYWMVGKKTLAIVNFLTFNYFLLGVIVVPIHCYSMISDAEEELRMAGVGGY